MKLPGSLDDCHVQQTIKKMKTSFLERYEDQDLSDEFDELDDELQSMKPPATDELKRYLALQIDKSRLSSNPLDYWRAHQSSFLQLSKLARRVNSIPATTAAVERQFSAAGLVINERRTSLKPSQVDNILFVRSCQKSSMF